MIHIARILSAFALVFSVAACGGDQSGYHLPVDSKLKPYQAPEASEVGTTPGDDWDIDFDEEAGEDAEALDAADSADAVPDAEPAADEAAPPASPVPVSPDKKTPTKPAKTR